MSATGLLELAVETLGRRGALVDDPATGSGIAEAILPGELSTRLGLPELVRLSEAADLPGVVRLSYGSQLLERLLMIACERPSAATATVVPMTARTGDLAELARTRLIPRNGVVATNGEPSSGLATYLVVDFRFQADADERHEGLVAVAIAEDTLEEVPRLAQVLGELELAPGADPIVPPAPAVALIARAGQAAERHVVAALAVMRDGVARRHLRDRARVRGYFAALRAEMEAQLGRRGKTLTDDEARRAKIDALGSELERKLASLEARYSIVAKLTPCAALRLTVPVWRIPLRLRRRKGERIVTATWSLATRAFDPFGCEACWAPAPTFALCDTRLHVLCAACDDARGSARACPACTRGVSAPRTRTDRVPR